MLIGEVIQRIQSLYSKGSQTDDTRLRKRHVYNILLTNREKIIKQNINKRSYAANWDKQLIPDIPLEPVMYNGCSLMKSTCRLPDPIYADVRYDIVVINKFNNVKFNPTTKETYLYYTGNKYTSKQPYYFIDDKYLYLGNTKITKVDVLGMWANPIEAYRCSTDYKCTSNTDIDFYTSTDIIETVVELTMKEIQLFYQFKEDVTNNQMDDIVQNTK